MTFSNFESHFNNFKNFQIQHLIKNSRPTCLLKILRSCILYDAVNVLFAVAKFLVGI